MGILRPPISAEILWLTSGNVAFKIWFPARANFADADRSRVLDRQFRPVSVCSPQPKFVLRGASDIPALLENCLMGPKPVAAPLRDRVAVRRALLSVYDKTGLVDFAKALSG